MSCATKMIVFMKVISLFLVTIYGFVIATTFLLG